MGRKTDKRTINTKKIIKNAVIDLMEEQQTSDISVTDISKRTGINRNTFYIHYNSVSEAISDVEDDVVLYAIESINKFEIDDFLFNPSLLTTAITACLINNPNKKKLIFESPISPTILNKLSSGITTYIARSYVKSYINYDAAVYYCIEFLIAGYIHALSDWY